MLLAALVSSYSQAVEAASELSHASLAKRRLMQVTEQLGLASCHSGQFLVVVTETEQWGVPGYSLCIAKEI
jgi:hypothetical protein